MADGRSSPMTPLVSVLMISYNHERFIREAVESALAQRTDFPIEVVIGDDASTDATPTILRELASKDARIQLILRTENLGPTRNYFATMDACRGRYIAVLEGDDAWIEPTKLQHQVALLQETQAAMVYHGCRLHFTETNTFQDGPTNLPHKIEGPLEFERVLIHTPTASVVFDREVLEPLPPEYRQLFNGDSPVWLLLSARGTVRFLPERWSIYRIHPGGIWSPLAASAKQERMARTSLVIATTLARERHPKAPAWASHFRAVACQQLLQAIVNHVDEGHWRHARPVVLKYLRHGGLPPARRCGLFLRILLGVPSAQMRSVHPLRQPTA